MLFHNDLVKNDDLKLNLIINFYFLLRNMYEIEINNDEYIERINVNGYKKSM